MGRKKKYFVKEFNPTCDLQQEEYIGASISWRAKNLIVQLRTNSHKIWCEMRRWKRPKEAWEERVCNFFISGAVESEKHFILECDAFKDIRDSYGSMLASIPWHCLFSEGIVRRLGQLIINLSKKRLNYKRQKTRRLVVPYTIFNLVDVKISFIHKTNYITFTKIEVYNKKYCISPKMETLNVLSLYKNMCIHVLENNLFLRVLGHEYTNNAKVYVYYSDHGTMAKYDLK